MAKGDQTILVLASAVAPFGAGPTGGVSRYAGALCQAIRALGYDVSLAVPSADYGNIALPEGAEIISIDGQLQASGTDARQTSWPASGNSMLGEMLRHGWKEATRGRCRAVINLNHDWLPYWLTPMFPGTLLHIANLSASDHATDAEIQAQHGRQPGSVACLGDSHRHLLDLPGAPLLPCDLDPEHWRLGSGDGAYAAYCGRLAPEKGILAAAQAAQQAGLPLHLAGSPDDADWWHDYWPEVEATGARHMGHLQDAALVDFLGGAACLVMAQRWCEAFGIVMAEAMLCGTPVAAYPRGGNVDMVDNGVSGILAADETIPMLTAAVTKARQLDRRKVRKSAQQRFTPPALQNALAAWFDRVLDPAIQNDENLP